MENKEEIKISNEPSLAERLEQEKREEERLHMLTSKSGDVPLIHTMESDVYDNIRNNNINKIKILSGQMDTNDNTFEADNIIKRRKIIAIVLSVIFVLLLAGGAAYYFLVFRKPAVVVEIKADAPKYTILDVWNDPESKKIFNYDTEATSTPDVIVIKIKNFDYIYKAILEDEKVFTWLAKNKFSYFKMGVFVDTTVQNINMRVADGETGAFVYGYVDQNYLIIANSISSYIKTYKNLKQ